MADTVKERAREGTQSTLQIPEKRIIRIRSPSPFRGLSERGGRSMTPLAAYRSIHDKSETAAVWRSITPFLSRDEKEKTPFEIGPNILQQLASYKAIIDKALVMDISLDEERPAKYILSDQSVIDKAAVLDLGNVEILYVEDDEIEESDFRESESPASTVHEDHEKSADLEGGSDEDTSVDKKKKPKKAKKVVKKKEKKEKEPSPPKLKLDLDKPKVNKAKMFEQQRAAEKPMDKPPIKSGKLSGALAAMKAEEEKMKAAEEQKKAIEEKMKQMKAEQEAKKAGSEQGDDDGNEEHSGNEGSQKGTSSRFFKWNEEVLNLIVIK